MGIVFSKAGQPAWAAYVPIYNLVVLCEIGDRSPMLILGITLGNVVPGLGQVIVIALMFYIYLGVVEEFNKGFIFALGLTFLPFIFYPLLAITAD